ncbi:hypothetical protein [Nocardia blacklockiae]|uniref:hypothetical protein n=1 Tax=Nocardia blacklockiae TaxID=480036 RepID=UPI001893F671|nr:hypothetical protein [Nocardia blacklockiae]MBF6169856.1 hypothetical protein [Nocardia blacklockiae]
MRNPWGWLEGAGVTAAALEALHQQLDHVALTSLVHATHLTEEEVADELVDRRNRLAAELELGDARLTGEEGVRRVGDELAKAHAVLAESLARAPAEVSAADAREIVAAAIARLLAPAAGATVADEPALPHVVAAASDYLALLHLFELVAGLHERD